MNDYNEEAEEFMRDPATPFWARTLIQMVLQKDCVDVAHTLHTLAAVFGRRADKILRNGG